MLQGEREMDTTLNGISVTLRMMLVKHEGEVPIHCMAAPSRRPGCKGNSGEGLRWESPRPPETNTKREDGEAAVSTFVFSVISDRE